MAQQTAVEWLVKQLTILDKELDGRRKNEDATVFKLNPNKLYEQAKEMDKLQKKGAWVDGIKTQRIIKSTEVDEYFEQYYTQNYGNNTKND
jgi:hypothetical protein